MTATLSQLITHLGLEQHIEGGYFKQTFKAEHRAPLQTQQGPRTTMTSIYYLLTADAPIGHFHLNRSDIMHYFHSGDAITYYLIHPDGRLETLELGNDLDAGQTFQFVVPGGVWKASSLNAGPSGYGLLGEAVAPGFEYEDMQLGTKAALSAAFPQHQALIERFTRE